MIEIKAEGNLSGSTLQALDPEKAEEFITAKIAEGIVEEIKKHIDEMAFIEIESTSANDGSMKWEAKTIFCSEEQITSSIGIMAQRLVEKFKATPKEIKYILESAASDLRGW